MCHAEEDVVGAANSGNCLKSADMEKLIRLEQFKIIQERQRVSKVQEGWEKGFYKPKKAKPNSPIIVMLSPEQN